MERRQISDVLKDTSSKDKTKCLLNICTDQGMCRFLQAILPEFVQNAIPDEDSLMDTLYSREHLTVNDMETFWSCTKRLEKSRMAWLHLNKMSLTDFLKDAVPILCENYDCIIPPEYKKGNIVDASQPANDVSEQLKQQTPGTQGQVNVTNILQQDNEICTRCELKRRISLACLADVLYHHGYLDLKIYEEVVLKREDQQEFYWPELFEACRRDDLCATRCLAESICKLLPEKFKHSLPSNFHRLLSLGLPCKPNCFRRATSAILPLKTERLDIQDLDPKRKSWSGEESQSQDKKVISGRRSVDAISDNDDLKRWAEHAGLSTDTVKALQDHDFNSIEDLTLLAEDKVVNQFQKQSKLPAKEFGLLTKAVKTIPPAMKQFSVFDCLEKGDDLRILLLGITGSGKSATGNTILGEEIFDTSPELQSKSKTCQLEIRREEDRNVTVMDSPGLCDTEEMSDEEICECIVQTVCAMHPGPNVILHVVRLGRYTREQHATYQKLKQIFDDNITNHMILLFTHGDSFEKKGMPTSAVEMIETRSPKVLQQVIEECGKRFIVFNNNTPNPEPQLEQLVSMMKQMIGKNGSIPYTCSVYDIVGEEMENEVARRFQACTTKHKEVDTSDLRGTADPSQANLLDLASPSHRLQKSELDLHGTCESREQRFRLPDGRNRDSEKIGDKSDNRMSVKDRLTYFEQFSQLKYENQSKSVKPKVHVAKSKIQPSNNWCLRLSERQRRTKSDINIDSSVRAKEKLMDELKKEMTSKNRSTFFRKLLQAVRIIKHKIFSPKKFELN